MGDCFDNEEDGDFTYRIVVVYIDGDGPNYSETEVIPEASWVSSLVLSHFLAPCKL